MNGKRVAMSHDTTPRDIKHVCVCDKKTKEKSVCDCREQEDNKNPQRNAENEHIERT
mgnify:CR=1 FL=1